MERVADIGGVLFVNDSKGTTVAATLAALEGIGRPAVLIAGGDGKGQDLLAAQGRSSTRHCRAVVLLGRDAPTIAAALSGVDAGGRIRAGARSRGRACDRSCASRRRRAALAGVREPRHVPRLRRARRSLQGGRSRRTPRRSHMPRDARLHVGLAAAVRRSARFRARGARCSTYDVTLAWASLHAARDRPGNGVFGVDRDGRGVGAHRIPAVVLPRRGMRCSSLIGLASAALAFQVPLKVWQRARAVSVHRRCGAAGRGSHSRLGKQVNGSKRWLSLFVVNLQPSELMKLFVGALRGELRGAQGGLSARRAAAASRRC